METTERWVHFEDGRVVLAATSSEGSQVLNAGDEIELLMGGRFQPIEVCHGGSRGWYYVTADGQPARFAVGMLARNYRARCSTI